MQKCKKERKKDKYEFMRTRIFILFLFIGGGDEKKGYLLITLENGTFFLLVFLFFFSVFFLFLFSYEDRCKASNVAMAVKPIPVMTNDLQILPS